MDSILSSIKTLLGVLIELTVFDDEIIMAINSAIMTLSQLGVGPDEGFIVVNDDQTWAQLLNGRTDLEAVKMLIYLKTRLAFDPPTTAHLIDAIDRQIKDAEWRIVTQMERTVI